MKITRWASSLVGREDEVERKTWVGEKNLSPIKQLLKRGHIVWREHVHIQARMHTLYNQLHELWCFGSAKKEEIGGHTICPPACVCIAYASLDVLCMSCYAISMSKLYSGAAFRHRQHRRLFPPSHTPGFALTHWYIFHHVTHSGDTSLSGMRGGQPNLKLTDMRPKAYILLICLSFSPTYINPYWINSQLRTLYTRRDGYLTAWSFRDQKS